MGFAVVDHESGTSSWDAAGSRQYEREMAALRKSMGWQATLASYEAALQRA